MQAFDQCTDCQFFDEVAATKDKPSCGCRRGPRPTREDPARCAHYQPEDETANAWAERMVRTYYPEEGE